MLQRLADIARIAQCSIPTMQSRLRRGLTVSEAMWKKKPVIGGKVGGIRLQIDDEVTGYLVDSVEACADRIATLISDPTLRYNMGNAGQNRVRERFLSLREAEDCLRLMASL